MVINTNKNLLNSQPISSLVILSILWFKGCTFVAVFSPFHVSSAFTAQPTAIEKALNIDCMPYTETSSLCRLQKQPSGSSRHLILIEAQWHEMWATVQGNKFRNTKDSVRPWRTAYHQNRQGEVVLC